MFAQAEDVAVAVAIGIGPTKNFSPTSGSRGMELEPMLLMVYHVVDFVLSA